MQLSKLYERDITRPIDSVAKVDHRDETTITQEIEEYFFTDPLLTHLKTFLGNVVHGAEKTTGFWINGFYGSGKSHFLKYLYYCLSNAYSDAAFNHLIQNLAGYEGDPLDQPFKVPEAKRLREAVAGLKVAPIMFNISAYAKKEEDDRRTVTETFFNRFNNFRGYHKSDLRIARFEQQLDRQGNLDAFKKTFADRVGEDWDEKALTAVDFHLDDVLDAAGAVADLDIDSTRQTLKREVRPSTDDFVDEIEDFLGQKSEDFRLVFLVDEVSQFMAGNTNMLLDLQTIVEELGTRCDDQAWVACTAQQELKELLDTAKVENVKDSFGKIIARFKPLPLEAQEADRIAKKRILEKSDTAERRLGNYFVENEVALRNQFARDNDVYQGFQSKDDFIESYPFVPYQFTLITDIIYSFVQEDYLVPGVSGTERSLIGITHQTAKGCKDEEIGHAVPLDAFYNSQIKDNLKNFARNLISKALGLEKVEERPFWQRVVKALFLLSHLVESKRMNFRPTAENLAFVLMDEVDQAKAPLQQQTQEALDYLVSQNIVGESDGEYTFLKEEEIRIKNRIDNFRIPPGERVDFLEREIVSPCTGWSSSTKLEGSKIRLLRKVDSKNLGANGTVPVQFLITQGRDPESFAFDRAKKDLVFCLSEYFDQEQQRKLNEVVKVEGFKRANYDRTSGKRREAIEKFADQSRGTVQELRDWFEKALKSCQYVSAQQIEEATKRSGSTAEERYASILKTHLRQVYKKREMATDYVSSRSDLKAEAAQTQREFDRSLTPAETEVSSYLKTQPGPNVADTIQHFSQVPYGWNDTETLHILLNLERSNKWRFRWNGEEMGRRDFARKAKKRNERASITLHEQESIDPNLMYQVVEAVNRTVFNESLVDQDTDPKQLDRQLVEALQAKRGAFEDLWRSHREEPFATHLREVSDALDALIGISRTKERFQTVIERASEVGAAVDKAVQVKTFLESNGETYRAIRDFVARKEGEFDALEPEDREVAEELRSYVRTEDRPDERFRVMKQYYNSVQSALNERVESLREKAAEAYEEAFDELEDYQAEHGVDDVLPVRRERLSRLESYDDPNRLQVELNRVSEFATEYHVAIRDKAEEKRADNQPDTGDGAKATPRTTEPFSVREVMGSRDLEDEEDIDAFLQELRQELVSRIDDNKVIVLS